MTDALAVVIYMHEHVDVLPYQYVLGVLTMHVALVVLQLWSYLHQRYLVERVSLERQDV